MCSVVGDKKVHFHLTKCTYQVSTICIFHCWLSYLNFLGEDKVSEVDIFGSCIALKKTATHAALVWLLVIRFARWNSNCRERKHKGIYFFWHLEQAFEGLLEEIL